MPLLFSIWAALYDFDIIGCHNNFGKWPNNKNHLICSLWSPKDMSPIPGNEVLKHLDILTPPFNTVIDKVIP